MVVCLLLSEEVVAQTKDKAVKSVSAFGIFGAFSVFSVVFPYYRMNRLSCTAVSDALVTGVAQHLCPDCQGRK